MSKLDNERLTEIEVVKHDLDGAYNSYELEDRALAYLKSHKDSIDLVLEAFKQVLKKKGFIYKVTLGLVISFCTLRKSGRSRY